MESCPKIWIGLEKIPIERLKLALLKKKNKNVDPRTWNKQKKGIIVS